MSCNKDCKTNLKCSDKCMKFDLNHILSITISESNIITISKKLKDIMNVTNEYINNSNFFKQKIEEIITSKNDYVDLVNKNGNIFHLKVSDVFCIQNDKRTIILFSNIDKEHKKIEYYKNFDPLLHLPNKYKMIKDLENSSNEPYSITTIEINKLDIVSDFYGFKVKLQIVETLKNIILKELEGRNYSVYCEGLNKIFLVNYEFKSPFSCKEVLHNIQNKFSSKDIDINGTNLRFKFFAGISFSKQRNKITTSQLSLITAKEKNSQIYFYNEKIDRTEEFGKNIKMVSNINQCIANNGFVPFFQPIINNETREIDKYEVLVRMKMEDKIISPYFFLDLSKKTDQYHFITKQVIEKSFKVFKNIDKQFSINISYLDIKHDGFEEFLTEMIKKYKVGKKLVLELLEDETIEDVSFLKRFIHNIKKLGVKISIDDFGSGYSNFGRLLDLEVDYLKIDAELIKHIEREKNYKTVKGIVSFAKSLNLKIVAEYVENKSILDEVIKLGIDYSQGYYFFEPLEDISNLEEDGIVHLDLL